MRGRRSFIVLAFIVVALIASACSSSIASDGTTSSDTASNEISTNDAEAAVASQDGAVDSEVLDAGEETSSGEQIDPSIEANDVAFSEQCGAEPAPLGSRVDVSETGSRIGSGSLDFGQANELEVELPDNGIWITADPAVAGGWLVVLQRGSSVRVSPDGVVTSAATPGDLPPELDSAGNLRSPFRLHGLFEDPISDGRVVIADDIAAVLSTPTDFYQHDVLGDALEAAAVEWVDTCTGESGQIDIAEPDVIEGISPILADIDSDGQVEILVTLSNSDTGARLAAFELDGSSAGQSEPIGRGNRWRNQLAVGAFGPDGEVEIIDVRTPHIGGTVQAFRQVSDADLGPSLVQVAASDDRYTSHILGLRNLEMGIAVDADGDQFPDILVATADRQRIVALTRTSDLDAELQGWEILSERELDRDLTSNIATQEMTPGRASVALADRTTLRIYSE